MQENQNFTIFSTIWYWLILTFHIIILNTQVPVYILVKTARECEGYIRRIFHAFDLFSSCLVALGKISVNRAWVKGHKYLASLLRLRSTSSHSSRTRVWISIFILTSSRSHLAKSLDEYLRKGCKPCITVYLGHFGSANNLIFDFSMQMKGHMSKSGWSNNITNVVPTIYQQMAPQTREWKLCS